MFEFINNPEERGQVGIGTLIVFIAMVLVAAIAAGVLINTAGFLQSQAEATGQESTDLVSERIEVGSSVGIVDSGADTLKEIRVTVQGAPGSDNIDLTETTIQAVGPGGQENLVFKAGGSLDNSLTVADGSPSVPGEDEIAIQTEVTADSSNIDVAVGSVSGTLSNYEVQFEAADGSTATATGLSASSVNNLDISGLNINPGESIDATLVDTGPSPSTDLDTVTSQVVANPVPSGTNQINVQNQIDPTASDIDVAVSSTSGITTAEVQFADENGNTVTQTVTASQVNTGLDISGLTINDGENIDATLVDTGTSPNTEYGTDSTQVLDTVNSVSGLGAGEFAVRADGALQTSAVLSSESQFQILVNPTVGAFNDGTAFQEGQQATLDIVSPAGATTQVELRAPDLFNSENEAVRL
jgi:flagellin-like protein